MRDIPSTRAKAIMSSSPMSIPRPRTPDALPEELGFGRFFTDRMFVQRYTTQRGWHDGAIVPYGPLSVDPAAQLFHCGQGIFEGMKALRRADGAVNLFRARDHTVRFNDSAQRLAMPPLDAAQHPHALRALLRQHRE